MNELKQGKERAAVLQRQLDTSLPNVSTCSSELYNTADFR